MKRIALLLLLSSCIKTEVLNAPEPAEVERCMKPHREHPVDSLIVDEPVDTIKVPIGFDASVNDWEGGQDINF